jgi:hypothetical protein
MTPIVVIAGRKARSAVFAPEEPAIHEAGPHLPPFSMDARVKPGHDERVWVSRSGNGVAR